MIERMSGKAGSMVPATLALAVSIVPCVYAEHGEQTRFEIRNTTYREECGSCHIVYPPQFLSEQSWSALMSSLANHFGSDASLDDATAREIGEFLRANAGRRATVDASGHPLERISETVWFRSAHRPGEDGLTEAIFDSEPVKSPANCGACHRQAADGDYSERSIRIPRGTGP